MLQINTISQVQLTVRGITVLCYFCKHDLQVYNQTQLKAATYIEYGYETYKKNKTLKGSDKFIFI